MAEPKWKKKQPEYSIDFPELTLEESQERFPREGVYIYDDKIHVVQSRQEEVKKELAPAIKAMLEIINKVIEKEKERPLKTDNNGTV